MAIKTNNILNLPVFKKHDFFGPEYPWASALSDPIFDKKEINIEKMRNAPAIQLEKADNIFEGEMKADQKSKLPGKFRRLLLIIMIESVFIFNIISIYRNSVCGV